MLPGGGAPVAVFPSFTCFYVFLCVFCVVQHVETRMQAGAFGCSCFIRKMSNKFPEVSQPQKPQETSENLGNLITWKLMSLFAETSYKNCPWKSVETWKPEKLSN